MLTRQNTALQSFDFDEGAPYGHGNIVDVDSLIPLPADFRFAGGDTAPGELRYRITGPENAPVIVALGGISADRNTTDSADGTRGWWRDFAGTERIIDTRKFRVLSFDYITPEADIRDNRIPAVSTLDQAQALASLLDTLDLATIRCFIGSSYGGMVGLAFAAAYPDRLEHLAVISAGDHPHPMGTAWRSIQRQTVLLGLRSGQGREALSLARQLAMTTYRSHEEFAARFTGPADTENAFPVEGYLKAQGDKFIDRMPTKRFLMLSQSIDLHRVDASKVRMPVTLIASTSDQIVPPEQMQALQQKIPAPCRLAEIHSVYGHDAFLKETDAISPILKNTLEELSA